jgi:hypothetical protein
LEKVEVGFVLYRPGKAHGRFSGNQRNVKGRQDPEIVEEHFEIVSRIPLISSPPNYPE